MAKYAPILVANMENKVHLYVYRLDPYLLRNCTITALDKNINIARI